MYFNEISEHLTVIIVTVALLLQRKDNIRIALVIVYSSATLRGSWPVPRHDSVLPYFLAVAFTRSFTEFLVFLWPYWS